MGSLSTRTLERRLLALDRDAFVEFVATLWRESGWTVVREDCVLEASRRGASKRLLVLPPRRLAPGVRRAPATTGSIDAVVTPRSVTDRSELPRGTPDVEVVDAVALRERLYYAVDDEARDELLATHLGVRSADDARSSRLRSLPSISVPRARRATAASAGIGLVLAGVLLLVVVTTGVPLDGSSSSGTVDATAPITAGSISTASAPAYEAHQRCERGPGEVVEISTAAVRGSSLSRGLVVMGNFWNPRHVESIPSGSWFERMQSAERMPFYDATKVTLAEPTVEGDRAVVNATAIADGTEHRYAFDLSRTTDASGASCWVIDRFAPA